jgi:hypothetical protein
MTGIHGAQPGDHNHQANRFPARGQGQPSTPAGAPPALILLWNDDDASRRGALHRLPDEISLTSPSAESAPAPVILIERCSGVQVGDDNDQYSVYKVTLPTVAIQSGQALAEQLLGGEAPWSDDLFSHDAPQVRYRTPGSGYGTASRRVIAGPDGNTLVIVRNCSAVQVGDHNSQHNQFRIRVAGLTVHADQASMSPQRAALISRLRENPGDHAAARSLAEDVTRSASIDITATLTQEVTRAVSTPQIDRQPGRVHDRTGIQIGGSSRATTTVEVTISKWDSAALEHQILKSAASLDELTRREREPDPPTPTDRHQDLDASLDDLKPSRHIHLPMPW